MSSNSWTGLLGSRPSQWRTGRLGFDPLGLLGWRKSQHYVFLAAQGLGSGLVAAGLVWLVAHQPLSLCFWGHEADDYGGCVVPDSPLEAC